MNLKIKDIGVDAGIIMIFDPDFFINRRYSSEEEISENSDLLYMNSIENGMYQVDYKIPDTWNGKISGSGVLKITGRRICVCDPCYIMEHDKWMHFLNDFDLLSNNPKSVDDCLFIDSMGGDGIYKMNLKLEKIEEI